MSEWIDFVVYAAQALLFWVFLPRHGKQFTLLTISDRNPEWLASHREVAASIERSRWFSNACYVWAAVSIAVLLGVSLEVIGPPFGAAAPKWEVLKDVHSTFLIVGALGWGVCTLIMLRWLGTHVPPCEVRRATLKPRVLGDYLSWPWRIGVETLTVLHLGAWIVIGVLGLAGGGKYWFGFACVAVMSVLFAVWAAYAPQRRPGFPDRLFGDEYRRVELRAVCVLRLTPLVVGGQLLAEQAFGMEPDRVGHLLLVALINMILLMILRLRPVAPGPETLAAEPRLTA